MVPYNLKLNDLNGTLVNFIVMLDRIESFVNLKKAAYAIAKKRGFFKMGIERYDMSLNLKERQITEHIIRGT